MHKDIKDLCARLTSLIKPRQKPPSGLSLTNIICGVQPMTSKNTNVLLDMTYTHPLDRPKEFRDFLCGIFKKLGHPVSITATRYSGDYSVEVDLPSNSMSIIFCYDKYSDRCSIYHQKHGTMNGSSYVSLHEHMVLEETMDNIAEKASRMREEYE